MVAPLRVLVELDLTTTSQEPLRIMRRGEVLVRGKGQTVRLAVVPLVQDNKPLPMVEVVEGVQAKTVAMVA